MRWWIVKFVIFFFSFRSLDFGRDWERALEEEVKRKKRGGRYLDKAGFGEIEGEDEDLGVLWVSKWIKLGAM